MKHKEYRDYVTALEIALILCNRTQDEVSRATGVPPGPLSQYKTGARDAGPKHARALAEYLDVPEIAISKGRIHGSYLYAILERLGNPSVAEG